MCKYTFCHLYVKFGINYTNNQREKQKWVTLSRRHVIDPTLNLKKMLQMGPRNKKYGTNILGTFNF